MSALTELFKSMFYIMLKKFRRMLILDKRYQVFVSSTFSDLEEERQEVMQALLELDCMPPLEWSCFLLLAVINGV